MIIFETTEASVKIQLLSVDDEKTIAAYWQAMEQRVTSVPLSSTWTWTKTWIRFYKDLVPCWVLVALYNDEPVGITLITRQTGRTLPFPVKAYHIGTAGEPYKEWVNMINNRLLVLPAFESFFIKAILTVISTQFPWEEIIFEGLPPDAADILSRELRMTPYKVIREDKVNPVYDFTDSIRGQNTITANLSKRLQYEIRRTRKEFSGDLKIEWAESVPQAMKIFYDMVALHKLTWKKRGRVGMFSCERYLSFHKKMITQLLPERKVRLFRIVSKRFGTLGCLYFFVDNNIAYGYQCGFRPVDTLSLTTINPKRLKIGYLVHLLCMEACQKLGIQEYNFSIGKDLYKMELASHLTYKSWISIRNSKKADIRDSLMKIYQQTITQRRFAIFLNPVLRAL